MIRDTIALKIQCIEWNILVLYHLDIVLGNYIDSFESTERDAKKETHIFSWDKCFQQTNGFRNEICKVRQIIDGTGLNTL